MGGNLSPVSPPAGFVPAASATIAIRPEHAFVAANGQAFQLAASIENIVFLGTDTHIHTRLDDGTPFVVRQQNGGSEEQLSIGQRIGICLADGAARLLRD